VIILAIVLSLGAVQLFLSWLNPLLDLSITVDLTLQLTGFLILLLLLVTMLSAIYPAWLTSSFRPADALRNLHMSRSAGGLMIRRGLVVLQFFISQIFIIGMLVLTTQMDFMHRLDIGFQKDNIISVPVPATGKPTAPDKMNAMKEQVIRLSDVSDATLSFAPPSYKAVISTSASIVGKDEQFNTQVKPVDARYIDVFGIKLLQGEGLPEMDTATGILVNEEFLRVTGLSEVSSVIGTEVFMWERKLPIKGVVKNFNTQSLSQAIEPVVMLSNISDYRSLSVRISTNDPQSAIKKIQTIWEATYPEYIFQFTYLEDQIRSLYRGETRITRMLEVFAGVAVVIGCLGLYGLITFIANRRTKEIGVRKILGASIQSIVLLFTSELGKLLIIGFAAAAPLAGFFMNLLLQEFAYRIKLGPILFLAAFVATFLIAFATISYSVFKAAIANPVDSLKTE
jgi:ABC-type antimicrobial peptide transport system permease subunit